MDADLLPVLVHIQSGLDSDLSAAVLAQHSGMSESTLYRRVVEATGETPRRHVERLRLERAAAQLQLRRSTILEIALDHGFASHEAFSRAFKRHFGMTPSAWRERQTAGGLGQHGRQPGLSESAKGASLSSTRLVEMRPIDIAFLRHVGPYDEVDGSMWARIRERLAELGLSVDGLPLGIGHDDPWITPPDRLRYDAGWTIDADLPPGSGLGQQTVPGGSYASTTYVGPFHLIGEAYQIIGERMARHAETLEFGTGGSVEWYRTGSIDSSSYLNQIDITFAASARAGGPRVLE
jgi:AraC family transcriptional regulator